MKKISSTYCHTSTCLFFVNNVILIHPVVTTSSLVWPYVRSWSIASNIPTSTINKELEKLLTIFLLLFRFRDGGGVGFEVLDEHSRSIISMDLLRKTNN